MPTASLSPERSLRKRVALLGMPNTGKSTFFNRLTGASARTGNWPGVTVDLLSAKIILGGDIVELIDLPGIYDLRGYSEDEEVVRRFLECNALDAVVLIVNAVQIERQLHLVAQFRALGVPAMLIINMQDEAERIGVRIDRERLSERLGMPVLLLSAKQGKGMAQVAPTLTKLLATTLEPDSVDSLREHLPGDEVLRQDVRALIDGAVHVPTLLPASLGNQLDRWLLHPWLGLPIFFGIMYLLFQGVYTLGGPLQDGMDWLFTAVRASVLEPLLAGLPTLLTGFLLDGVWNGVATVATFVPVLVLFFLFMAMIEDTGYFSRAAYLMDAFMAKLGLDGRSFVMILMGFGCNVPALMGTRVMRTRGLRLLTMFIIPFSLCSARLQVFLFLIAILFAPTQAALALFSLYVMSILCALLTALLFKRQYAGSEPFILELPPYRLPTLRMMVLRGWQEVRHFLKRASKYITAGVVLVWLLTNLPPGVQEASLDSWAGAIGRFFEPVLSPIGIDGQLAIALIFGFVAKEIVVGSLAVIYGLQGAALEGHIAVTLDWVSAYSFMLFTLIYTPCLSTIATIHAEAKSRWFTFLSVAWPLALAWVVSYLFYTGARALGF